MGSAHPPLESLLTFSQSCLEGFELASLNRIAMLRKEFHELVGEWIGFELEASFARWILGDRDGGSAELLPDPIPVPVPLSQELAMRGVARGSAQLDPSRADEFPHDAARSSILDLHAGAALDLRLAFHRVPVSQDASAALRSLEQRARCKAESIGDPQIDFLDRAAADSASPLQFLLFPHPHELRVARDVPSPRSCAAAAAHPSDRFVVRLGSVLVTDDSSTPLVGVARSSSPLISRVRRRAASSVHPHSFAAASSHPRLHPIPPVRFSFQSSPLQHAATLLRN